MTNNNNNNNNNKSPVWYITGATSGTGLALAETLLSIGHKVVGTSRDIKKWDGLSVTKNENFLGLQVDILIQSSIEDSVKKSIEKFGGIDVLVNNAGYGLFGAVEEISDKEQRDMMDALYFGPLNTIRAILPHFRAKKSGYIFNISSIGGIKGFPRRGAYIGAKFALVGMSESLAEDVKPFGIKVSCVILGYFKTGFQTADSIAKDLIPEYDAVALLKYYENRRAQMIPGDPNKFAEILIETQQLEQPPLNLILGADSFQIIERKITELQEQISTQKEKNSAVGVKE